MLVTSASRCGEKWSMPVLMSNCAAAPVIVQANTSRNELRRAFASGCGMAVVAVVLKRGTFGERLAKRRVLNQDNKDFARMNSCGSRNRTSGGPRAPGRNRLRPGGPAARFHRGVGRH